MALKKLFDFRSWNIRIIAGFIVISALIVGASGLGKGHGLGYSVVTDYQKALSAPMTSTQTFVPVTSLALKDGTILTMDKLGSEVFLTLEPGAANEEIVMCTDIDVLTKHFIGCTRGLAFSGTSTAAVTANQRTHSSGSSLVISNVHYVYNNYLDKITTSTQTVLGDVTFYALPTVTSTTLIPSSDNQLTTWYGAQTLIAGGFSSLNVSSTLGLKTFTGLSNCSTSGTCVGINLSSLTSGLYFDSSNSYALTINTSSTGGLIIDATGKLAIDTSDAFIWSGNQTFNGSTVFGGSVTATSTFDLTTAPVNSTNVVNYQALLGLSATGTAQIAVTAGQALWLSATTSQLMPTNSSIATSTFQFVGIAATSVSAGQTVIYTRPGGVNCSQSGLTTGVSYYLNGTAGQINRTPGTFSARIGIPTSATCIQVMIPKFIRTGTQSITSATTFFQEVGFYPAIVHVRAGGAGIALRIVGTSDGDDTNNCVFTQPGSTQTAGSLFDATKAWRIQRDDSATAVNSGTVSSKTVTGFILTASTYSSDATVQWIAESE